MAYPIYHSECFGETMDERVAELIRDGAIFSGCKEDTSFIPTATVNGDLLHDVATVAPCVNAIEGYVTSTLLRDDQWAVFAVAAYVMGNYELAAMASAALHSRRRDRASLDLLECCLTVMRAPESAEQYREIIDSAPAMPVQRIFSDYHLGQCQGWFKGRKFRVLDHHNVRSNALMMPTAPLGIMFDTAVTLSELWLKNSQESTMILAWENEKNKQFDPPSSDEVASIDRAWKIDENKRALSRLAAVVINRLGGKTCLDFGSHAGTLLGLIGERNPETKLIGIELHQSPIDYGKLAYPEIEFYIGDERLLADFPAVDLFILSSTCLLNRPEAVDAMMRYAERCGATIIADDFCNLHGGFPVVRRYYLLHPWQKILGEHGLTIDAFGLLPRPTLAANCAALVRPNGTH